MWIDYVSSIRFRNKKSDTINNNLFHSICFLFWTVHHISKEKYVQIVLPLKTMDDDSNFPRLLSHPTSLKLGSTTRLH